MKVTVNKAANKRLVAVVEGDGRGVYFRLGDGSASVYISAVGTSINVHQSLESIARMTGYTGYGDRVPVYEGDTLTIGF